MGSLSAELPSSNSPTLSLVQASEDEKLATWKLNGKVWRGKLSLPTYLRREFHLANQAFTRDGGITYWILVDTAAAHSSPSSPRTILGSCESIRKRALITKESGLVEEVISHGIGSVFCNPEYRGKGYAGRMMKELGKKLDKWQQDGDKQVNFTVLYSDIGKKFYAQNQWKPFPSTHIALPPISNESQPKDIPQSSPLYADHLIELCNIDEAQLRKQMAKDIRGQSDIQVALIPDVQTMQWHHAREEFAAKEVLNRTPEIKGAIVKCETGQRIWCIWTRTFGNEESGNTLHILRLVIEGEEEPGRQGPQTPPPPQDTVNNNSSREQALCAAAVLYAAQQEAADWNMNDVQLWNPTPLLVLAAKELQPTATVIDRDEESITSLRWHGREIEAGSNVQWIGNEKYGWC